MLLQKNTILHMLHLLEVFFSHTIQCFVKDSLESLILGKKKEIIMYSFFFIKYKRTCLHVFFFPLLEVTSRLRKNTKEVSESHSVEQFIGNSANAKRPSSKDYEYVFGIEDAFFDSNAKLERKRRETYDNIEAFLQNIKKKNNIGNSSSIDSPYKGMIFCNPSYFQLVITLGPIIINGNSRIARRVSGPRPYSTDSVSEKNSFDRRITPSGRINSIGDNSDDNSCDIDQEIDIEGVDDEDTPSYFTQPQNSVLTEETGANLRIISRVDLINSLKVFITHLECAESSAAPFKNPFCESCIQSLLGVDDNSIERYFCVAFIMVSMVVPFFLTN